MSETAQADREELPELAAAMAGADSGVLLAILVQLTGDVGLLDRFVGAIEHHPDPPEKRGRAGAGIHQQIVDRLLEVLADEDFEPGTRGEAVAGPAWDPEVCRRLFEVGLGEAVGEEYVPMLLEQGGFRRAQPTVPRTGPIRADTKVAIVGAGLAGIAAALTARRAGVQFEIFERNAGFGGTWLTQVYPGVGVDTPAAYYSLSTDLNPDWSSYYPRGGEYREYLRRLSDRHGLEQHTHFRTEVESLHWDEERTRWSIGLRTGEQRWATTASFVITAAGFFNRPRYPDWPGRDSFAGLSVHSGEWDEGIDLSGQRVAVVGTGCTAVQIVDSLVEEVEHLTLLQRQPHWVAPRKRADDTVAEADRVLLRDLPLYVQWRRLKSFWGAADNGYPVVTVDPEWAGDHVSISPANDALMQDCLDYIDRSFGAGSELAQKVTPDFAPFGKRIIRDPGGYYAALTRDDVSLVCDPVDRVVPAGIIDATGRLTEVDAIIYATGYHVDFLSTVDIRGRSGTTLAEEWAGDPRAYRGGMVPGFPNLFITSAPNQLPSHGAGNNFSVEIAVHYIFECIQLLAERGAQTVEPTREAYDSYVERIDADMEKTVWRHSDHANTYYRNRAGRVVVACPWRLVDVWHEYRAPSQEDLVIG